MNCNTLILQSIDGRCDTSMGGIKRILITNRDNVDTAAIVEALKGSVDGMITSVPMVDDAKFSQWLFRKNTGSYNSSFATDVAIGNTTVTTEVALQFSRAEADKRMKIQSALVSPSVVIVEDMYGAYIFLGLENEVTVTSATMTSGTQTSDLSGFNLIFTDIAQELPHFIKTGEGGVDITTLVESI